MEMLNTPDPTAAPVPRALCPHCRQPLDQIGWLVNQEANLVTFFHAAPECGVALNCQFLAMQQPASRIELVHDRRRLS